MMEEIAREGVSGGSTNDEVLASIGQGTIETAYITSRGVDYDITNFMIGFVIFEDLYSTFLSGQATITDAASLLTKISPYGAEFITLAFRARQGSAIIKKSFNIFSIKNRAPTATDREQTYTIHFTSAENVANNNIVLSQKFVGSTDKIVTTIFDQYLKLPRFVKGETFTGETPFIISGTPHITTTAFIPGFWSPAKCLNWLASRSIGSNGQAPNYLFFETTKNFFFASIEDLITTQRNQNAIFDTYVYSPTNAVIQNPSSFTFQFPELGRGYSLVRSIAPMDMFDTLEGQDRGFYGSTVTTFDLLLKEPRIFIYDHVDGYQRFNHMQDYTVSGNTVSSSKSKNTRPFGDGIFSGVNSKRMFRPKMYNRFNDFKDPLYQTWLPQRNSLLSQMNQWKIAIEVPGRADVEVGKLVNFLFPRMKSSETFELDPQMSGLYMITSVKHAVTRQQYSMTLELTKDSFMESV